MIKIRVAFTYDSYVNNELLTKYKSLVFGKCPGNNNLFSRPIDGIEKINIKTIGDDISGRFALDTWRTEITIKENQSNLCAFTAETLKYL